MQVEILFHNNIAVLPLHLCEFFLVSDLSLLKVHTGIVSVELAVVLVTFSDFDVAFENGSRHGHLQLLTLLLLVRFVHEVPIISQRLKTWFGVC